MLIDRDFRFVATNAAYEAATMRSKAELVGQLLFDLFPNEGESGRRLRASMDRVFSTGESDTLAYLPYDIPRPEALGGGFEQRYWTAVHVPVRDDAGDVAFLLQNPVDVTELVRMREAAALPFRARSGESALIERAREAEEAHQALLADSEDFRRLFQQAPGFIAVMSGPNHVFAFVNDAYRNLVGGRSMVGLDIRAALPEVEGQGFFEMLDAVYRDGMQRGGEGARIMLRQTPDAKPREAFLDFSYAAIRDHAGEITGVFVQGMDRTESFKAQRRQRLLLDELNHRVKNTLATVQSIAAQTFRNATDTASAKAAFEARIVALSRAHNLLSQREWANAELETILAQQFDAFPAERREIGGPPVVLNAKSSIALAMVINELTTNAAKHGALSTPSGAVSVTWNTVEEPDGGAFLILKWLEKDGPAAPKPSHAGFGTRMIDRAVSGELAGHYDCAYTEEGFSCQIKLPLDVITGSENAFV